MDPEIVLQIGREAILLTILVCAPPVVAALVVGLLVSTLQAATQIQEQTLTFVPKLVAVCLVLALAGLWIISQVTRFTANLFDSIPRLVAGG